MITGKVEISLSERQLEKIGKGKLLEFTYPIESGFRKNKLVRIKIGKQEILAKEQRKTKQRKDCFVCLWNKKKGKFFVDTECVIPTLAKQVDGNCTKFKKVKNADYLKRGIR